MRSNEDIPAIKSHQHPITASIQNFVYSVYNIVDSAASSYVNYQLFPTSLKSGFFTAGFNYLLNSFANRSVDFLSSENFKIWNWSLSRKKESDSKIVNTTINDDAQHNLVEGFSQHKKFDASDIFVHLSKKTAFYTIPFTFFCIFTATDLIAFNADNPLTAIMKTGAIIGVCGFVMDELMRIGTEMDNCHKTKDQKSDLYLTHPYEHATKPILVQLLNEIALSKTSVFIFSAWQSMKLLKIMPESMLTTDLFDDYLVLLGLMLGTRVVRHFALHQHPINTLVPENDCEMLSTHSPSSSSYTYAPPLIDRQLAAIIKLCIAEGATLSGALVVLAAMRDKAALSEITLFTGLLFSNCYNATSFGLKFLINYCCRGETPTYVDDRSYLKEGTAGEKKGLLQH